MRGETSIHVREMLGISFDTLHKENRCLRNFRPLLSIGNAIIVAKILLLGYACGKQTGIICSSFLLLANESPLGFSRAYQSTRLPSTQTSKQWLVNCCRLCCQRELCNRIWASTWFEKLQTSVPTLFSVGVPLCPATLELLDFSLDRMILQNIHWTTLQDAE